MPIMYVVGLSMKLVNLAAGGGENLFVFEHSKFYQKIQFEFLNAVESLEPQNVVVSSSCVTLITCIVEHLNWRFYRFTAFRFAIESVEIIV